ncbi:NADPH-dependent FMN reductase [Liquorilactobacillus capillatus]|uniref:Flavoprotein n=1 Tax=Liquorilactobacillus capillatus DSM 19910 TaxID=1423731 RepID=A0A0R1LZL7_9LACO|nr:NADPH-dependent FMN reductase [Liquorilactobacillus capillatus]KRL00944.1 flavoprotein [Liquorilactobacillus capillatus DSM 19910]
MYHFIGIVGTNDKKSTNRQLMQYLKKHYAGKATVEIVEIGDLPIFYKEPEHRIPAAAEKLAHKIEEADGVVIATPEYDHAVPAVLSSALAWLSYFVHPFVDKPVMITGASYGALGTSRAQSQLRQILDSPELHARVMPSSEFLLGHSLQAFDENGDLIDPEVIKQLDGLFADFLIFVKYSTKLTHTTEQNKKDAANVNWQQSDH